MWIQFFFVKGCLCYFIKLIYAWFKIIIFCVKYVSEWWWSFINSGELSHHIMLQGENKDDENFHTFNHLNRIHVIALWLKKTVTVMMSANEWIEIASVCKGFFFCSRNLYKFDNKDVIVTKFRHIFKMLYDVS